MPNKILMHNDVPEKCLASPILEQRYLFLRYIIREGLGMQKSCEYLRTEKTLAILPIARILFLIISFRAAAVPTFNGIRESLKLMSIYRGTISKRIEFNTTVSVQYSSQEASTQGQKVIKLCLQNAIKTIITSVSTKHTQKSLECSQWFLKLSKHLNLLPLQCSNYRNSFA